MFFNVTRGNHSKITDMSFKEQFNKFIEENKFIVRQYGVSRVGLFGSVAREEDTDNSDLDLIVDFIPGGKNYDNFINFCFFLEEGVGRKIDLLTKESLSPLIWEKVQKEIEYVQITP